MMVVIGMSGSENLLKISDFLLLAVAKCVQFHLALDLGLAVQLSHFKELPTLSDAQVEQICGVNATRIHDVCDYFTGKC
jgi:hypothetical protein